MTNAFARAMLDQWKQPEREVRDTMHRPGWLSWVGFPVACRGFLVVRDEEKELLRESLEGLESPRVLDVGCGIGRHLEFLRQERPDARLTGLEINDLLREHCGRQIAGARFLPTLDDLPAEDRFDLVLLLGNNLGLAGDDAATRQLLERLYGRLAPRGRLLVEAGNRYSERFDLVRLEIRYQDERDGPLAWGYASQAWLQGELEQIGFDVRSMTRSGLGPEFFFCLAVRPA